MTPEMYPELPPHKNWFSRHMVLGYVFVGLAFAAAVWGAYELKFGGKKSSDDSQVCIQVIQRARNPQTGEVRDFPTPCDVPEGWEKIYEVDETANWQTYRSEEYGFEIKYPNTWKLDGSKSLPYLAGNYIRSKPGMSALLCDPPYGCQDSTIRISAVENMSIDELLVMMKASIQIQPEIQETKFLAYDAKTLIFHGLDWKEILFQKNDTTFSLAGEPGNEVFNQILSTFKFIDN